MRGSNNHPNMCLFSRYYSRQQVWHLFTVDWLSMEWNSINATPFQKSQAPDTCNIATTRAIRCTATSVLAYAYRHVAYLAAAFLGFLRCHARRRSKTVTISTGWKIFSTVFANSRYYQRVINDVSTFVGGANNWPCCGPGGLITT